jgi:hypothetical protein
MNRSALVLASALLGTGCIVVEDDPPCGRAVTLEWDFQDADGAIRQSCAGAGVSLVDVFVNDGFSGTVSCAAGAATVWLAPGTNLVRVEGIDPDGFIAYRDERYVEAPACGSQVFVPVRPAEGRIDLDYAVDSTPPCASGGTCFVWFAVFDEVAGEYAAVVNAGSVPTAFPYPSDVVFRLPAGTYTVAWMQIVSGGFWELQSCSPATFTVRGGLASGERQLVPSTGPVLLESSCN